MCIIGSGNWGSAIAKIVGRNVLDRDQFEDEVTMWVFQENVDGKNLTDIINNEHENVKYLPVRPPACLVPPVVPVVPVVPLTPHAVGSPLGRASSSRTTSSPIPT